LRTSRPVDLEWQERVLTIRAAARKGKRASEIAERYELPVGAVERVLAPVNHPRLSDPVPLIQTREAVPGRVAPDVQLYWLGFLMAVGRILGQGTSFTLVVTLGTRARDAIEVLMADLLGTDTARCEFCHSSLGGWQVYLRDPDLCKALLPWGVPSNFYGGDVALLDDLPNAFAAAFLRGYVDGLGVERDGGGPRGQGLLLTGDPAVLAGINAMIERAWGVSGRVGGRASSKGTLRFSLPASRAVRERLDAYPSRLYVHAPASRNGGAMLDTGKGL
jgi:hypothetical protein